MHLVVSIVLALLIFTAIMSHIWDKARRDVAKQVAKEDAALKDRWLQLAYTRATLGQPTEVRELLAAILILFKQGHTDCSGEMAAIIKRQCPNLTLDQAQAAINRLMTELHEINVARSL